MSFFNYKNKKVYYEEIGSGKPVLLLHGNTASSNMFLDVVKLYKIHIYPKVKNKKFCFLNTFLLLNTIVPKLTKSKIHLISCTVELILTIPGFRKNIVNAIIIDFIAFTGLLIA